jgi:mono/diheme cytochrome c family protein
MKLGLKFLGSVLFLGVLIYWFIFHSGFIPYTHNPMQYMPDMHKTPVVKPEAEARFFSNKSGSRIPPAGVISRDANAYLYTKDILAENVPAYGNPLPISRQVVERGKLMYNTHCVVCHGAVGHGDGSVVPPFPKPPSLHSERIQGLSDSQIFHIITVGQNTMMAYGSQVRPNDRWSIAHYIRVLQLSQNPRPKDLEAFDRFVETQSEDEAP